MLNHRCIPHTNNRNKIHVHLLKGLVDLHQCLTKNTKILKMREKQRFIRRESL